MTKRRWPVESSGRKLAANPLGTRFRVEDGVLRPSRPANKCFGASLEPAPLAHELGKRQGSKEAKKKAAP